MEYFLIYNNRIIRGPMTLPTQWSGFDGTIHQLDQLTPTELSALGWLPLNPSVAIPREPYESIASHTFTINGTQVDENIVLNALSLVDVVATKIGVIQSFADGWGNGTFTWNNHTWIGDTTARQNLTGMTSATANGVSIPPGFVWADSTGVEVPMSAADLVDMGTYMLNWVNTIYAVTKLHITNIQALTIIDDVINYDHTIGWPV